MHIRDATIDDVPEILEIFNYEIVNTQHVYLYDPWTLDYATSWFQDIKGKGFPFIVAVEDDRVIGYSYFTTFRAREAYNRTVEYSVYIHQAHRRKGIARLLVTELIDMAKAEGYHTMIGGLDSANTKSMAFHESLGFKKVAHFSSVARKFDTWLDLVFYQLMLNDD